MSEEIDGETDRKIATVRNRLRHFVDWDEIRSISKICVKDGCAYATDGRVAVRWRFADCGDAENDEPDNYPTDRVDSIIGEGKNLPCWYRIDMTHYGREKTPFLEKYENERAKDQREASERYKLVQCPSCGDYLYWDTWEDKLVEDSELEVAPPLNPRDMVFPVSLVFAGDCQERILVNFGYLLTIVMALGEDILFCVNNKKDLGQDVQRLFFRSADGSVNGVLMPLRVDGSEHDKKHEISMVRA